MSAGPIDAKIVSRDEAIARFGPGRGDRLVLTNGCFDLLHAGHRSLIERARALGDRLVVALNSDASVRELKGPGRPVHACAERAGALAALDAVDGVVVFEEATPLGLIEALLPDVLVKGADYASHEVVGREVVERAGGRLVLLSLVSGVSTSRLIAEGRGGDALPPPTTEREAHGLRIVVDRELCLGYADCIAEAPAAFDLDDEGRAILTRPEETPRAVLLAACAACPVDAIRVWEDGIAIVP